MGKYVKEIQIKVNVNCYEILQLKSHAAAEATKIVDKEALEKHLIDVVTNALTAQGLHPSVSSAYTFIHEEVDDEID